MQHGPKLRTRARRLRLCLGPLGLVAATCLLVCGCSPGADYPSMFPAVHDMPPPRADTTLNPVQVQQATEDLITERNHLNGEAQGPAQKEPAGAANAQPARNPAVNQAAGASQGGITPGSQTAGAETK